MHLIHISLVSQSSCQERKWAPSADIQGWVLALCWEYASLAPKVLVSRENIGSVPLEKGRRPAEWEDRQLRLEGERDGSI